MALLTAFFSLRAEKKRKKSCGGEAGRRDDGGDLEPGRGMAGEAVRMAAGWLEAVRR